MTTKLVIIGLPSAGKTTVFNALTKASAQTGNFGGASDEPNLATVKVPDPRLDRLIEMFNPQRKVPADVQYLDVAGMAKGMAEKGMSGQLLGHLAQGDALVHVVRAFQSDLPHPDGSVDPMRDIETLNLELTFSDLGIIEKRLLRLVAQIPKLRGAEREAYEREQVVMNRLKEALEGDIPLREIIPTLDPDDVKNLRGFGLLTAKPLLILLNIGEAQLGNSVQSLIGEARERFGRDRVAIDALAGQIEAEIAQLDDEDAAVFMTDLGIEESSRDRVIRLSFELLGLIPFFTVGPDECRAWTIRQGETAVEAASAIHSDIQRGFIRAECVSYDDLIAAGGLAETKKSGTFRREGKTYIVQDGDVINFLFNVSGSTRLVDEFDSDQDSIDINLRSRGDLAARIVVLAAVIKRAVLELTDDEDDEDDPIEGEQFDLVTALSEGPLGAAISSSEIEFVKCRLGQTGEASALAALWRIEALAALIWAAADLTDLPEPWTPSDPGPVLASIPEPWDDLAAFSASLVLRPEAEIAEQRERAELWAWRCAINNEFTNAVPKERLELRSILAETVEQGVASGLLLSAENDFGVRSRPFSAAEPETQALIAEIATQRLYALNWLCGFGESWDSVPLDI